MKVVFMGGKAIGCAVLTYLLHSADDTEVVGVVVNPGDMVADRWYPSAAEIAMQAGIPVMMPTSVNDLLCQSVLHSLDPDVIVVCYYDQILSEAVFGLPKLCINVHMALAERYRGCYPTTWAILNGEQHTGVTIHKVTAEIDGGDIIAEDIVCISDQDTGESLYYKCSSVGARLFKDTWPGIVKGTFECREQGPTYETSYYKRVFPSGKIDFTQPGPKIYDHIRAMMFHPFPRPFFHIGGKKFEVVEVKE